MARLYRFENGFEGTVEDYLFTFQKDNVAKITEDNNMGAYKRRLFNQKDHAEQLVYITRLFKKRVYSVELKDGRIYDVKKSTFDAFMDVYIDTKLFQGGAEPFEFVNKYVLDYEAGARAWLKY